MPILKRDVDLYPGNLLVSAEAGSDEDQACWWALYTRSRREKELMRKLLAWEIPFYGPLVTKRMRSPSGRVRTAYVPLFSNYVFMYGNVENRYTALTSNCVSRCLEVGEGDRLRRDLQRVQALIQTGALVTPEARLESGTPVRVKSGRFKDFQGLVIERRGEKRLLVSIDFLQQGASVLLEDFEVEPL